MQSDGMSAYKRIRISLREVNLFQVIQAVAESFLLPIRAAQRQRLSTRQVHRLTLRYREAGVSGLIHVRGQTSTYHLRPAIEQRAATSISLIPVLR